MKGYYLATNVLAWIATAVLAALALTEAMPWWLALLGVFLVQVVAHVFTMDETKTPKTPGDETGAETPQ